MRKNLLKRIVLANAMMLCTQPLLGMESTNSFSGFGQVNRPQAYTQQQQLQQQYQQQQHQQPQFPINVAPQYNAPLRMNTAPQNQIIPFQTKGVKRPANFPAEGEPPLQMLKLIGSEVPINQQNLEQREMVLCTQPLLSMENTDHFQRQANINGPQVYAQQQQQPQFPECNNFWQQMYHAKAQEHASLYASYQQMQQQQAIYQQIQQQQAQKISAYQLQMEDTCNAMTLLTTITELDFESEEFNCFPIAFCSLPNLTHLKLSQSFVKNIPEEFEYLITLKHLDLGGHRFTSFPKPILKLTNLEFLSLADDGGVCKNNFKRLPESFGCLKKLKTLELGSNNLTSLPESIGDLEDLEDLALYDNNLKRLPDSFSRLITLKSLDLGLNKFENVPDCLIKLTNLYDLNIVDGNKPIYEKYRDISKSDSNGTTFTIWGQNTIQFFLKYDREKKDIKKTPYYFFALREYSKHSLLNIPNDVINFICSLAYEIHLKAADGYYKKFK